MKALRVLLISLTLAQVASVSLGGTLPLTQACPKALHACIALSQAQDQEITQLKQDRDKLAQALVKANQAPLLPTWAWVTIGILAGTVIGSRIK